MTSINSSSPTPHHHHKISSSSSTSEKTPLLSSSSSNNNNNTTSTIPQYIIDRKKYHDNAAANSSSFENIEEGAMASQQPYSDYDDDAAADSSFNSWDGSAHQHPLFAGKSQSKFKRFLYNIFTCCGVMSSIGENIKSILYGGLDGITTVFVSVATIYSGNVSILAVLIIGIAKLLSGSLSMGVGDFMSSKAELDLIRQERKRELWECENFLQGEMNEMVDIYSDKGIRRDVADKMVGLMSKNKEAFVDVMMVQELGLKANYDPWAPLKNGITNFMSFIFFGMIPLVVYIVFLIVQAVNKDYQPDRNMMFFIDCGITVLALVAMGSLKARFSTEGWFTAIFTTLLVGFIAAGSGYLVALGLDRLVGFKE